MFKLYNSNVYIIHFEIGWK